MNAKKPIGIWCPRKKAKLPSILVFFLISSSIAHAHPLDELEDEAYQPSAPKILDIAAAVERDGRIELGFFIDADALLNSEFRPEGLAAIPDSQGRRKLSIPHRVFIEEHVCALTEVYADEEKLVGELSLREIDKEMILPRDGKVWVQFSFPAVPNAQNLTLVVNARVETARVGVINATESAKSTLVKLVKDDEHVVLLRGETVPSELSTRAKALRSSLYPKASSLTIIGRYTYLGFIHILPRGLDHILFVLALFLLAIRWKPLLIQVTLFTLAHTVTLGLSTMGFFQAPAHIVEPLIALSICYVAIENCRQNELNTTRMAVVFGFGLLHGMGFAGVLNELGLPESHLLTALLSFNAGVELGQITVIAAAAALIGWFRDRPWFRSRVVNPLSLAIAAIGLFWTVERVFA